VPAEPPFKQGAVNIAVSGHYTMPNWYDANGRLRTFTCRTSSISPYQMLVNVPVVGKVGNHLSSYFREFGSLNGRITDAKPGSVALALDVCDATRERLANKLAWLQEKMKDPQFPELRKDGVRVVPENPHSTLTLANGDIQECVLIDMSVGGAAVSAEVQLPIGTALAIGSCVGRIVRIFDTGFAVRFTEKRSQQDLERLIIRSMPPHLAAARNQAAIVKANLIAAAG
jgi:hypothetical protein